MINNRKIGIFHKNKRSVSLPGKITRLGGICFLSFALLASCALRDSQTQTPSFTLPTTIFTMGPTAQASATGTLQPSPTQPGIATSTPSPIPTATQTQTPVNIAVVIQLWGDNVLGDTVEVLDENFNFLYRFPSSGRSLSSFSPDGCYLRAINYSDGEFTIRELDLQGVEIRQIKALSSDKEDESKIYQYRLSPSGRWLAYKVVDQVQMMVPGAKIQDVRLLRVDEQSPQDALHLTERGGAHPAGLVWSPDSRFVAFIDDDEAGVVQIYVYAPEDEQEYQITHFDQEMREHKIQVLSWSPDSHAIAFSIAGVRENDTGIEHTDNGMVGIISVPDFSLDWIKFEEYEDPILYNDFIPGSTTFWWSQDGQTVLIPFAVRLGNTRTEYLAWYDLRLGKAVDFLSNTNLPDVLSFWSAFPLDDIHRIGFWGSRAVYTYNRDTREIVTKTKEYSLRENGVFLVAPNGSLCLEN